MTIRLASAASAHLCIRLGRARTRATIASAANDNIPAGTRDVLLHAALRQFARHGIGSAEHARRQAERAFFKGDRETYQWWLGICRMLDHRLTRIRHLRGSE